jgi:hypothetical protein
MRDRARRRFTPALEPMEGRIALSTLGMHHHHERAVPASLARVNDSVKAMAASQRANGLALKNLEHQLHVVQMHAMQHRPSALPTKAQRQVGELSSTLKSIAHSL